MPNFDGTGPLKRGRAIGRGLGPCKHSTENCTRKVKDREPPFQSETAEE
jgi:hypothetical protein